MPKSTKKQELVAPEESHDTSASDSDDDPTSFASRLRKGVYRETAEEYHRRHGQAQASDLDSQAQASASDADSPAQAQSDADDDLDSEPLGNLEEHDPSVVVSNQDPDEITLGSTSLRQQPKPRPRSKTVSSNGYDGVREAKARGNFRTQEAKAAIRGTKTLKKNRKLRKPSDQPPQPKTGKATGSSQPSADSSLSTSVVEPAPKRTKGKTPINKPAQTTLAERSARPQRNRKAPDHYTPAETSPRADDDDSSEASSSTQASDDHSVVVPPSRDPSLTPPQAHPQNLPSTSQSSPKAPVQQEPSPQQRQTRSRDRPDLSPNHAGHGQHSRSRDDYDYDRGHRHTRPRSRDRDRWHRRSRSRDSTWDDDHLGLPLKNPGKGVKLCPTLTHKSGILFQELI